MKSVNSRSLAQALGMDVYPSQEESLDEQMDHDTGRSSEIEADVPEDSGMEGELLGSSVFTPHTTESANPEMEADVDIDAGALEAFAELQKVHRETLLRVDELKDEKATISRQLENMTVKWKEQMRENQALAEMTTEQTAQIEQYQLQLEEARAEIAAQQRELGENRRQATAQEIALRAAEDKKGSLEMVRPLAIPFHACAKFMTCSLLSFGTENIICTSSSMPMNKIWPPQHPDFKSKKTKSRSCDSVNNSTSTN